MSSPIGLARRSFVGALFAYPLGVPRVTAKRMNIEPDTYLRQLEMKFFAVAEQVDLAIIGRRDLPEVLLNRLDCLEKEIINTPATTVAGFRSKARAASWAILGEIDPNGEATLDRRITLSIVRDLLRFRETGSSRPRTFAGTLP